MTKYQAALIDLDGTVWRGDRLIEGANEGLDALREAGVPILFFTNAANLLHRDFVEKLDSMGVPSDIGDLLTAGSATAAYITEHYPDSKTYVIGYPELIEECEKAGIDLVDSGAAEVVVVSRCSNFDFELLTRTLDVFTDQTVLLAPSIDQTHPIENTELPGAGAFVGAVSGMTGADPTVVGKPSSWMAKLAARRLGVEPSSCLIVGDRLESDIEMGERVGMTTALVLTGAADRRDIPDTNDDANVEGTTVVPDYVLDSLADVGQLLDCSTP